MNGQWLESVRNIAALTLVLLKTNLFSFGDMVSGGRPAGSKTKRDKKRGNRANRGDQASSGDQANHGDQPSRVDQANRDRTLSRGHIVFLIILPLCLLPATASICLIAWQFIGAAKAQGLEHILIGLYLSAIALATMALGLYHVMNIFYLANYTERLLPLPLRPHEILIARFLTVLAYELVAQFFLLAPALVVYGIRSGTPLFWVYAIIFYILFPLAPLVLSSLLALLIKPVIDRIRNSDTV
ncbi:MAG: hypothetical protein LBU58_00680, partial [Clostridiales bacterium]|nr:hypothetical protein [Clostridiales bacterium]